MFDTRRVQLFDEATHDSYMILHVLVRLQPNLVPDLLVASDQTSLDVDNCLTVLELLIFSCCWRENDGASVSIWTRQVGNRLWKPPWRT